MKNFLFLKYGNEELRRQQEINNSKSNYCAVEVCKQKNTGIITIHLYGLSSGVPFDVN